MPMASKNKSTRPTIQAIADKAGVSRATVSLILTNRSETVKRFKAETVAHVREIAAELGYRANIMATSLRSRHPSFFGLIMRGVGKRDAVSWHHQAFEGQFQAGAMKAARDLKLYPVLATQESLDDEDALPDVLGVLDGGVRGAVFRTPVSILNKPIDAQIEQGLPVVIVFPEHPETCDRNTIDMDNVAAGRLAGELLINAERRRLVVIREERAWEALELREEGFGEIARDAGAEVHTLAVPADRSDRDTMKWLAPNLAALKPDGVFAASSVTGVGALLACQSIGLKVPEQICLVGCDASLWRAPGCPGITSIDVSWYAAGELAVRKMAELSEAGESVFERIVLPPYVRRGESCPCGEEHSTPDVFQ